MPGGGSMRREIVRAALLFVALVALNVFFGG
jgi:hypothetical protein